MKFDISKILHPFLCPLIFRFNNICDPIKTSHCHRVVVKLEEYAFYICTRVIVINILLKFFPTTTDVRNCNYGHPKMADVESGKNVFCRLNCFYKEITNYD